MILDFTKFCAYICPICAESSIKQLNIFDFSGSNSIALNCADDTCRENCVNISKYNDKHKIEIVCPVCGESHVFNIKKNTLWSRPSLSLKCPVSGINIFFVGTKQGVTDAVKKQQHIFDDMRMHNSEINLVLEIIECINSFAEEKRMYCECGCREIRATVTQTEIILTCPQCGNTRSFEISIDTLSMLLNLNCIVLK